jgi:hypothetical protein
VIALRCYGATAAALEARLHTVSDLDRLTSDPAPDAVVLAERLLGEVGTRLVHSAAVAEQIEKVSALLEPGGDQSSRM